MKIDQNHCQIGQTKLNYSNNQNTNKILSKKYQTFVNSFYKNITEELLKSKNYNRIQPQIKKIDQKSQQENFQIHHQEQYIKQYFKKNISVCQLSQFIKTRNQDKYLAKFKDKVINKFLNDNYFQLRQYKNQVKIHLQKKNVNPIYQQKMNDNQNSLASIQELYSLLQKGNDESYSIQLESMNNTQLEIQKNLELNTIFREFERQRIQNKLNNQHCSTQKKLTIKDLQQQVLIPDQIMIKNLILKQKQSYNDSHQNSTQSSLNKQTNFTTQSRKMKITRQQTTYQKINSDILHLNPPSPSLQFNRQENQINHIRSSTLHQQKINVNNLDKTGISSNDSNDDQLISNRNSLEQLNLNIQQNKKYFNRIDSNELNVKCNQNNNMMNQKSEKKVFQLTRPKKQNLYTEADVRQIFEQNPQESVTWRKNIFNGLYYYSQNVPLTVNQNKIQQNNLNSDRPFSSHQKEIKYQFQQSNNKDQRIKTLPDDSKTKTKNFFTRQINFIIKKFKNGIFNSKSKYHGNQPDNNQDKI